MARTTTMPPRTRLQALHHPLRFPTIVPLIVAGAAHIPVTREHLKEAPYIGAGACRAGRSCSTWV
ncbi:hypothetical protein [Streptomyces tsukubensis]|uniref:Uncharacterized protein n=1 Tax=Streptomyces tsukubensis TaxID=83656 RepID=A0A1V4AE35_9ACTN|nr:hypothetical protein [Streptomyces tsukubensis]OON81601.1 hypothetical protein B1H18_05375 [Streptomyces tsukubensis]QFR96375.1 hypothetical protein GBW32_29215 [Streptomyces tsukubensis]